VGITPTFEKESSVNGDRVTELLEQILRELRGIREALETDYDEDQDEEDEAFEEEEDEE
jgi:hypothetical protein